LKKDGTKPACKVNGKLTREYSLWCAMMNRVYNEKQLEHHTAYRDVTVCERWHSFANFLEDLSKIKNYDKWFIEKNYEIDKDTLQPGVEFKVYSLETCMFIPKEENLQERNDRLRNRPKKEKPAKLVKMIRVTNIETGSYKDYQNQEEVSNKLDVTQSYVSRLISKGKIYNGFRVEKIYVPVSNN
jgi:hypothetical protein